MQLDLNQLRELLAALDRTEISELTLKGTDFELTVRKGGYVGERVPIVGNTTSFIDPASLGGGLAVTPPPAAVPSPPVADNAGAIAPPPAASPPSNDRKLLEITSPMVGTFYRAPAPDEPPFVDIGDRIRTGQTVCIIEAMKLMNELEAEVSGQVAEILVENGEPVEYGQVLMRVEPT